MLLKVYKFKFLLALLLLPFLSIAQPVGWDLVPGAPAPTHDVYLPGSVTPTVNGVNIAANDWVGLFFYDGTDYKCCFYQQFLNNGSLLPFVAYADDFFTPVKDGFAPGEDFLWKINASGVDYWANAAYSSGTNQFLVGVNPSVISSLAATTFVVNASASPEVLPFGGGMSTLTGAEVSGGPALSWEWFDGATSIGTTNPIIVSVTATKTFKVVAFDGTETAEANVTVTVADVYAGADAAICSDPGTYQLADASASGYLALSWAGGTGSFDDPFSLNPTYTAGAGEVSATLTLTIITLTGTYSDEMTLTIQPAPYISILAGGADTDYVCCGEVVPFVDAVGGNYTALQWYVVNSPGGYFDNENILNPTYFPSPFDCDIDPIIIGVTADPQSPCIVGADDLINLYFVYPPEANAGAPGEICSDVVTSYTFSDASVTFDPRYGGTILWTTTGDGFFNDATIANPTYFFGPNDLAANGTINFTLTVQTLEACPPAVSTNSISVQLPPTVWAGNSVTICEGDFVELSEATAGNYSMLQWYTTNSVGGYFANESDLNTTFYPGGSDPYLGYCVELWLAAYAINPCSVSATDSLLVCWQLLPTVVAGPDATVCSHELYTTNPTVTNSNGGYLWTVDPPAAGVFANPTALVTTFNPAAAYEGQTVILTLTAQPIDPCSAPVSGSMNLYIEYAPFVDAGPDMTICDDLCATIHGVCLHVSMGMWATTGDGTFTCPGPGYCLETVYCPGPGDLAAGCVTLVLIGYPAAPCTLYKLDKMVLCFDPHPTANAGPDMLICEDATAQINGVATNTDGIQWLTSGTGSFNDETIQNPIYTPSFEDSHLLGSVTLTMLVGPAGACTVHAEDSMVLTLQLLPVVNAGADEVICVDGTYTNVDATAANYNSLLWLGGDGTFNNASILHPTYTPGAADLGTGSVVLTLIAQPISPCLAADSDDLTLSFQALPTVWAGNSVTICDGDFVVLSEATASNYTSLQWYTTNSVGGYFDNENDLNTTFYPGGADPNLGYCIELWITVQALTPCTVSATDSLLVCFQNPPTVNAGPDATICANENYTLSGATAADYSAINWYTPDGTGTFNDATLVNPTYLTGAGDAGKFVTLVMQGLPVGPCVMLEDEMILSVVSIPVAFAGAPASFCADVATSYTFSDATATFDPRYGGTIIWTSTGSGTFNNNTIEKPTYFFGANDLNHTGSINFTMTIQTAEDCGPIVSTNTLSMQLAATVDAGINQTICEDVVAQLAPVITNGGSVLWSSSGTGTFIPDNTTANAQYDPSTADVAAGFVTLTITVQGLSVCTPVSDYLNVYFQKNAIVNAGPDQVICENICVPPFSHGKANLNATASNYTSVHWTSPTAGTFTNANILNPVYTLSSADITNGSVQLCITAQPVNPCVATATDCMTITVRPWPQANAGPDQIMCSDQVAHLSGSALYYSGVFWDYADDLGNGTWTGQTTLTPTYTPGSIDIAAGGVDLFMVAFPLSPCTFPDVDYMHLTIDEAPVACFVDGPVCENIPATFNPACSSGDIISYSWNFGDGSPVETYPSPVIVSHLFANGSYTVTLAVTSPACTDTYSMVVTVYPLPVAICPADFEVCLDAPVFTLTGGSPTGGVYSGAGVSANQFNAMVAGVGPHTITYTYTDNNGCIDDCSFVITVLPLPTITCPGNITVNNDPDVCGAIVPFTATATGIPAPDITYWIGAVQITSPWFFEVGTTTVTAIAWNKCGAPSCTFTVTVIDVQNPTITCPTDITVSTDLGYCFATGVALGSPVTADNCGVASVENNAVQPFALGTTVVTWTVYDAAGNSATCTQNVTVIDTELPTITCPGDVTVPTDAGFCYASGVALGTPLTGDNCSVATVVSDAIEPFALGTTVVTWTVTDGSGNIATCTQNVTVIDTELPTITCPSDVTVPTDLGFCYATGVALGTPLTGDNCSIASVVNDVVEPFALGTTVVTWTVTDGSGNIATCTQNVTVIDTELPTITCPADVTVPTDLGYCFATGVALGTPLTGDNCSIASVVNDAVEPFALGTTVVTWTITDGSGNFATCAQNVIVIDTELPTITCPGDVTVPTDLGFCYATGVDLGTPLTGDNCSVASVVSDAVEPFALGTTVVTWTVTDGSGNIATCTQNVTVIDTELPTITCPADVTVPTDLGFCYATGVALGTPLTGDNCSVASVVNDAVEPFALGTTLVTWTVTDGAGNIARCTQNVTVIDTELPTITCPSDVTVPTDLGFCYATGVALGTPLTGDNCSVASVVNDAVEPFALGTTVVTWTVTDGSGNTATCTQNVIVVDTELPTITCPGDVTVSTDAGFCYATGVDLGTPVTADNCSVASVVNDGLEPFALGTTVVTWTVTDGSGNTATCTQNVTVIDTELPTITCPGDVTVSTDAGFCYATGVALGTPLTADNCSVASVVNDGVEPFALGTTVVTWTVTDGSGNTATCTQNVIVVDTELPTITCPADVTVPTDAGFCYATGVALGTPVTGDNCSVASVVNDAVEPFALGTTIVTWTVTDGAGNIATCVQNVIVIDTELPTITCPGDVTVPTDAGFCYATGVALGTPVTGDNCSVASVVNDAVEPFALGTTVVTWTVTDGSGNTATCTQNVTVIDTELPTITCPADVTVPTDLGFCYATGVALGTPLTGDNCSIASVVNDAVEPFALGTTLVTWTVTDGAGNFATCTQNVIVIDTQLPTITCPVDITVPTDAGLCSASGVVLGNPYVYDNCSIASLVNDAVEPFLLGTTVVTWTVTDGSGNIATCTQNVTVIDMELPTITCPADVTVAADAGFCYATGVALGTPVTGDNCSVASVVNNAVEPFAFGTTVVIWTVTDGSGNTATCEQFVTVIDTELPTITCPADVTVNVNPGTCFATGVNLGVPTIGDNCAGASYSNDAVEPYQVGTTVVTWTVTDGSGNIATCTQNVIVVAPAPTANAGADLTVCDDAYPYTLSGSATNYSDVLWTTTGDGFFDDEIALNTSYYPGSADLSNGFVELCLTANPESTCPGIVPVTDCMILTFNHAPTAYAGSPITICEGETVPLTAATASFYSSVAWTTSGLGVFSNANALHPVYTPSAGDISNGGVTLTLTAYPSGVCVNPAVSSVVVTIVPQPSVDLGLDFALDCADFGNDEAGKWDPIELNPTVTNFSTAVWTTNGDGYFEYPTLGSAIYHLGLNDIWGGEVEICVTVSGLGTCAFQDADCVIISVPQQLIKIENPGGVDTWWGLSSYLIPNEVTVPGVMAPVVGAGGDLESDLVIMINKQGRYYWPEPTPAINQLGNWAQIGYKAKFDNNCCLPIYGDTLVNQSFTVSGAFDYIPVLTNIETPIADLFAGHLSDILLIYDWAPALLWTQAAQDFTVLEPGRAYLLVSRNPLLSYTINFPNYDKNAPVYVSKKSGYDVVNNSPWNDVVNTSQTHFILFADQIAKEIKVGDIFGAFNEYGECVGMNEFTERDSFLKLIAMGDDAVTESVDGFQVGENMNFKLYRQETGETFEVSFTYDPQYPSYDGNFTVYGVSRVIGMTMNATSINDPSAQYNVNVFPNPANEVININSDYIIRTVTLVNYVGQTVFTDNVNGNNFQINVSNYTTGMYFVRVETVEGNVITKRITIE